MEAVGHTDLGGRGFKQTSGCTMVSRTWATGGSPTGTTAESSVSARAARVGGKVIDVGDPAGPQVVATLQNPPGTSAEDVVVYIAENGPLAGRDVAAAGIQVCGGSRYDTSFARGLMLWDVTDPSTPQQLGLLDSGCCTRGVHEFEVRARADLGRTFAYASVPTSEYSDSRSPSGHRDRQGRGDFRLFDITDAANPFEVSDWGVLADRVRQLSPAGGRGPTTDLRCEPPPTPSGRLRSCSPTPGPVLSARPSPRPGSRAMPCASSSTTSAR